MSLIDCLYSQAIQLSNTPTGTSDLIYYTIGNDLDYLKLLELSVSSLTKHRDRNFDILILTTESYLPHLQASKILRNIPGLTFHVVTTEFPDDGVYVSMNKLKIFDYPGINKYRNILFLDCDIICVDSIAKAFNYPWKPGVFYSMCNPSIHMGAHQSIYHGLDYNDLDRIQTMAKYNQFPFNAGQFFIVNSTQMKKHFENIIWLANVWPGCFFFEQCFMNRYFCGYAMTSAKELNAVFSLVTTTLDNPIAKGHKDEDSFIHFIAPPTDPLTKINFIEEYARANQLRL